MHLRATLAAVDEHRGAAHAACPYPAGCPAALSSQRERDQRPEEQELWRKLERAAAKKLATTPILT